MMCCASLKCLPILLAIGLMTACVEDNEAVNSDVGDASVAYDPVTMDAPVIDLDNPPTTIELSFNSAGAALNGHLYLANGAGPHPTVILLHGLPGNEKNLDLAQAIRRAGFNILFFHYRGAWGSQGDFSFANLAEDALAAGSFVRSDNAVADYRVDPSRITYLGHSMGGFAALHAGARDIDAVCVGAMSPADLGVVATSFEDEQQRVGFAAYMDQIGEAANGDDGAGAFGPLRGVNGASAVAEITEIGHALNNLVLAPEFVGRSVLLTAAWGDNVLPPEAFHDPLIAAYAAEPAINLTEKMFDGDHTYSWERIALSHTITDWLNAECR